MAGPAYLKDNELATSTVISSSSADADFPVGNLGNLIAANQFKWSEDVSGGATIWVEFDFSSARSADSLVIVHHNFPSGTTFSLKADDTTPPTTVVATPVWREFGIWVKFTDPSVRYYRLEITITSATSPEIGELYLGTRVALTSRRSYGFEEGIEHKQVRHETARGCKNIFPLFDRNFFSVLFRKIRDPMIAELDTLERAVNGSRTPFIWIPDTDLTDAFMVRKMGDYRELSVATNEWDVDLLMEEESPGKIIPVL